MNRIFTVLLMTAFLLTVFPISPSAQINLDSLSSILNAEDNDSIRSRLYIEEARKLKTTDPASGIALLKRFDRESIDDTYPQLAAWYVYHLGELYYNNNQPDTSEFLLLEAYDLANTNQDLNLKGNVLLKLSDLYAYYDNLDKKTEVSLEAQEIFESIRDTSGYIRASKQVANSLSRLGRSRESIKLGKKLLSFAKNPQDRANIYNGLSIAYEQLENYDSTYFYQLAYRDEMDKTDNFANRFIAYYNLALTEQNLGKLEKAEATFNQALELAEISGVQY